MKKLFLLIFLFQIIINKDLNAQKDTIISIKGNIITGILDSTSFNVIYFSIIKKNGKQKNIIVNSHDVFCVIKKDGTKEILYFPDTLNGYYLSQDQMDSYLQGVIAAKKEYKNILLTGGSILAGAAGGWIGFWGAFIPIVYTPLSTLITPSSKHIEKHYSNKIIDIYFVKGYQSKARKRNVLNTFIGGFSALITGV